MNFKEYFLCEGKKRKEPNFCYMLYTSDPYSRYLKDLQQLLQLDGDKTKKNEFHCTIRYVKSAQSPDIFIEYLDSLELPKLSGVTKSFDIFSPHDDKAFVVELETPEIRKWFNKTDRWLKRKGFPKSDYRIFKPHITLTYGTEKELPDFLNKKHKMKIVFDKHVVTDQDYKVIFEKHSI
jgi:2'-5' RNA ligase